MKTNKQTNKQKKASIEKKASTYISNISSRLRSNPPSSSSSSSSFGSANKATLLIGEVVVLHPNNDLEVVVDIGVKPRVDWRRVAMVIVVIESFILVSFL